MSEHDLDLSAQEFSDLVAEVLGELARDPDAAHLWHWQPRPGCDDEPAGRSRRNHLRTLLSLMGVAVVPGSLTACGGSDCGDDPCADSTSTSGACADDPCACADDPC
ncbi:MAG: hypothetical protein KC636_22410 [Myxococcales bacterium]|nr:hypothetical protein [Myxococcales bacterium]